MRRSLMRVFVGAIVLLAIVVLPAESSLSSSIEREWGKQRELQWNSVAIKINIGSTLHKEALERDEYQKGDKVNLIWIYLFESPSNLSVTLTDITITTPSLNKKGPYPLLRYSNPPGLNLEATYNAVGISADNPLFLNESGVWYLEIGVESKPGNSLFLWEYGGLESEFNDKSKVYLLSGHGKSIEVFTAETYAELRAAKALEKVAKDQKKVVNLQFWTLIAMCGLAATSFASVVISYKKVKKDKKEKVKQR